MVTCFTAVITYEHNSKANDGIYHHYPGRYLRYHIILNDNIIQILIFIYKIAVMYIENLENKNIFNSIYITFLNISVTCHSAERNGNLFLCLTHFCSICVSVVAFVLFCFNRFVNIHKKFKAKLLTKVKSKRLKTLRRKCTIKVCILFVQNDYSLCFYLHNKSFFSLMNYQPGNKKVLIL